MSSELHYTYFAGNLHTVRITKLYRNKKGMHPAKMLKFAMLYACCAQRNHKTAYWQEDESRVCASLTLRWRKIYVFVGATEIRITSHRGEKSNFNRI